LDVVTLEEERLAGGALALLAAVHEHDPLLGGRAQDRLLLVDLDLDAHRLETHDVLVTHGSIPREREEGRAALLSPASGLGVRLREPAGRSPAYVVGV